MILHTFNIIFEHNPSMGICKSVTYAKNRRVAFKVMHLGRDGNLETPKMETFMAF